MEHETIKLEFGYHNIKILYNLKKQIISYNYIDGLYQLFLYLKHFSLFFIYLYAETKKRHDTDRLPVYL